MTSIQQLDVNMIVEEVRDGLAWYDIRELGVEGRGWEDVGRFYSRLPARAEGVVPTPVWDLGQRSAGLCVRFVTDAQAISATWTLYRDTLAMDHMPATGVSGLDLYVRHEGKWRWVGIGRPTKAPTNSAVLVSDLPAGTREYLLYLPLYNGVERVQIGLPERTKLAKAPAYAGARRKPICFYGTSVVQGGCASRPGMVHSAILQRKLDWPVINLGFSGNGKMDPSVIELLAELDVAAYVLDCLPNMDAGQIAERLEPGVKRLRQAHPTTPIVLVENLPYQQAYLVETRRRRLEMSNAAHRAAYERLIAAGVGNLHYVPSDNLLGDDSEATVDGTHATDVGFQRIAAALEPAIRAAVGV